MIYIGYGEQICYLLAQCDNFRVSSYTITILLSYLTKSWTPVATILIISYLHRCTRLHATATHPCSYSTITNHAGDQPLRQGPGSLLMSDVLGVSARNFVESTKSWDTFIGRPALASLVFVKQSSYKVHQPKWLACTKLDWGVTFSHELGKLMNQASADELTISHFQKPSRPLLPRTGYKPLLSTVTLYGRMLLVFANPFNAWAW